MDGEQNRPVVVVAGATGDLGTRIVRALAAKGVLVRALVRRPADKLAVADVEQVMVDLSDSVALTRAVTGAVSVVSALNGTEAPVILGAQGRLLDAAVAGRVPHFVPVRLLPGLSGDPTRATTATWTCGASSPPASMPHQFMRPRSSKDPLRTCSKVRRRSCCTACGASSTGARRTSCSTSPPRTTWQRSPRTWQLDPQMRHGSCVFRATRSARAD